MSIENTKAMTQKEKDELSLGMYREIRDTEEAYEDVCRTIREKEKAEDNFLQFSHRGLATLNDFREVCRGDTVNRIIAEMEEDFLEGSFKVKNIVREDIEEQGRKKVALLGKQDRLEDEYRRFQNLEVSP